jgi:hypothetical protein
VLHCEVLAIRVRVSRWSLLPLLVKVGLCRERIAEFIALPRRMSSTLSVLVEGALIPLMEELIVHLLIIGCKLLSLPTLEPLLGLGIVLVDLL